MLTDDEDYFAHEGTVFTTFLQKIEEALTSGYDTRVFADASHLNQSSRAKVINNS